MASLTKNPQPAAKIIFFECKLQDLPRLLSFWPGWQGLPDRRNYRAKPPAFRCFFSAKKTQSGQTPKS